jgi:hypothetical protein
MQRFVVPRLSSAFAWSGGGSIILFCRKKICARIRRYFLLQLHRNDADTSSSSSSSTFRSDGSFSHAARRGDIEDCARRCGAADWLISAVVSRLPNLWIWCIDRVVSDAVPRAGGRAGRRNFDSPTGSPRKDAGDQPIRVVLDPRLSLCSIQL